MILAAEAISQNVGFPLKKLELSADVDVSKATNSKILEGVVDILLGNNQLVYFHLHFKTNLNEKSLSRAAVLEEEVKKRALTEKIIVAIKTGQKVKYNRSKLMFIGPGGAGKTSTIRSLLGKPFQPDLE